MKWFARFMLIIGMILVAAFDVENNLIILGSGVGALAFTWSGVALSVYSSNIIFIGMSVCCALLSGAFNLQAQQSPHIAQHKMRDQIAHITEVIKKKESSLYSQSEIIDCFNDIPQPCKSASLEAHNARTYSEIDALTARLNALQSQIDIGWQEPTQLDTVSLYGRAFFVPLLLSCFGAGLRGSFETKKPRKNLNKFEPFLNFFKRDLNKLEPVLNETEPNLKEIEQNSKIEQAYKALYKQTGTRPKPTDIKKYVKENGIKGLSDYSKIKAWFDNLTEETDPIIIEKQERPLQIIYGGKSAPTGPTF